MNNYLTDAALIEQAQAKAEEPMSLEDVQRIVQHLLSDGTQDGLILGNLLNTAMGASARRRRARLADGGDWCEPCAKSLHGSCQGHRVTCDCTCGEAGDGGRLG